MQIPNHPNATPLFSSSVTAQDVSAGASSSSSSNSATSTATITADDFLQLLVTELQNQDPTADTDPNEYVDQLVQVNSLQQQIQMNQTLDGGPTLTGASSGVLQELVQMNQTLDGDVTSAASSPASAVTHASTRVTTHAQTAPGNLSPATNPNQQAAETVATALVPTPDHASPAAQTNAFEQFAARLKASAPQR
jgi:flagellar basal-body rod modification protein FlgD